jgi:threonine dehydratase
VVEIDDIRRAAEGLRGIAHRTPITHSDTFSRLAGCQVLLKHENRQKTGSFKVRGAYTRIRALDEAQRAAGVVAPSAGNHAQAVAWAARSAGVPAVVYMPEAASLAKVGATEGYGATVRLVGASIEESVIAAREDAQRDGHVLVHPFDDALVIAGQGTVGLEILEQVPDVATVLVCTGGGGLLGGIAAAIRAQRPDVRIIGVQAAGAAAWPASLAAGVPVPLASMRTIADGIAVGRPGNLTFDQVSTLVDDILTVDEDALSRALLVLLERAKMLVEPAGAAAVAALMEEPERFATPVVAVLSGGNIDPLVLWHVLQHGMAAAGRYLTLRVRVGDRPGALAALLVLMGQAGANVVDVAHSRISGALPLGDVDIDIVLETRGTSHSAEVVATLNAAGHHVEGWPA